MHPPPYTWSEAFPNYRDRMRAISATVLLLMAGPGPQWELAVK